MNTKPIFNPDPDQLNRLLSIGSGTEANTPDVCEDRTVASLANKWLASSLRESASLRDPLMQKLSCLGPDAGSFTDKSLFELLLAPETDIAVLEAISCYAKELSLSVQTESESVIAISTYYAAAARLLLSHDKKAGEYSYGNLMESFSDLIEKKWMPRELKEMFREAQKTCKEKLSVGDKADDLDTRQKPQQADTPHFSVLLTEQAAKDSSIETLGGQIGRYRLLSILGEGGMGIAYLAEQEHPIRRQVALKIIKPGMDSKRVIARFEAERQALALLDHPNIAHVYDAGTTENGRPYFVMEYVKGLPITEHCDHHKLLIEDRLTLFLQVCHAVQHAHQKGIIHRDIKSSNILVSLEGDQTLPKVIDFGIAKALAQPLSERTFTTEQGQLFGTPEYMSPEQADLAYEDVDIRSDVYSLGVLLYVLLTGVLPFDSEALRKGGIDHIRHMICEADPKTPSTRLTGLGKEAKKVAQSRRTEIAALAKKLHKELEWIPLKAMRKVRSERYRSAAELADDIEHYLEGKPLIAGPLSTMYQLKKLVHRHQALVVGFVTVLIVLVLGIVVSTLFALKADRALAEAQAVSDFLQTSVIRSLSPYYVGGRIITSRSVLDNASEDLEDKLVGKPLAEAAIRQTLAVAYWSLGLYEQAEQHQKRTIEIRRAELGAKHPDTLESIKCLGWTLFYRSRYEEAEQLLTEAVRGIEPEVDEGHWNRLSAKSMLATVYYIRGHFNEGEQLHSEVVETVISERGEEHASLPIFMNGLAWGYRMQGRYDEAQDMFERALESSRRVFGERHWETLIVMQNFGELRWKQGRYDEAENLLLTVRKDRRDALGEEHYETLLTIISLGWLYCSQGRYEEAQPLFIKAIETGQTVLGDAHICTLYPKVGLGALYVSQERYDKAEPLLEETVAIMRRAWGEKNWITLNGMNVLARLYMAQRRYDEAEHLFVEALKGRSRVMGNDHPDTLETKNDLALLYKEHTRYEEAEKLLLEALEGRRLKLGDTHPHTIESINNLIDLYEAWNKPEQSEEWRVKRARMQDFEE